MHTSRRRPVSAMALVSITILQLMLCMVFMQALHAQEILEKKVTLSVKNKTLEQVVALIRKQTGAQISYSEGAIELKGLISFTADNKKLLDVLKNDLAPYNIDYRMIDEHMVLFKKSTTGLTAVASVGLPTHDNAATAGHDISGYVYDENRAPVMGATITEKGGISTSANELGAFKIRVKNKHPGLIVTNVGYELQELTITNDSNIKIVLKTVSNRLNDVVVVGYGKQKKINHTGAIATIGTTELVQSPVANISNSLIGRLPGLFATQGGGEPGNDGSIIRIRGVATFSGNTNPLFLVDGIEVSNYNNIDPNEIESLTILKDASSTAVYGIRGANGVIIITTRRGKPGPPKVSYTFNQGFNAFTNLRTSMTAAEYATGYNAAQQADAYAQHTTYTPRYSPADIELYQSGADPVFHPNRNWFKELFRKVSTQSQHNLNISGGQNKVRYFISGGFFNQQGLFKKLNNIIPDFNPQSVFRRYNMRSNFNFDVTSRLKLALDLSSQTEIRSGNSNVNGTERVIGDIARASPLDGPGVVNGRVVNINPSNNNPYSALLFPNAAGGVRRSYRNYLNGALRLDEDLGFIAGGLAIHALVGIQTYNTQDIANTKVLISYMAYRLPDGVINYVPNATETQFGFSQSGTNSRRITAEAGMDYKKAFGNHNVTALLLYNQQKTFDPSFQFLVPKSYQSYVSRITYDFNSRYLAEINVGYNGSENFAPGKRFGLFPAFSIGWIPSEEPFFPKTSFISLLKFRGSYGEVGYDQIGGNRFLYNPTSYTAYNAIYYFGNIGTNFTAYNGIREGSTGNRNVTWERSAKKDIGMEMRLLKDHLSLTVDLFQENRDNILAQPQSISSVTGLIQPSINLGKMENQGYEGEICYKNRIGRVDFHVSGDYSFARNKVIFRDEIPPVYAYQKRTGQRLGQPFAIICDGIFNTWEEVNDAKMPVYAGTNKLQPGDLKFRDVNGDGIINDFDAVPVGYSNIPEKTYGVTFGASYKGFDVSVLFQGVGNVSLYYSKFQRTANFGENPPAGAAAYMNESWTPERYAAGLPIRFPRFSIASNANLNISTFYLADASYLRIKNTEIGYTARPDALKKIGISSCRLYAIANNLVTWSKMLKGIDPENVVTGENSTEPYPLVRTVNVGLNVNF